MNNAICFFVDSVTWNSLGTRQASVSPTPFLDSLKEESITTTKLYSHGPYTDAATHSLFTGRDCLDDFSYYFKLNTAPIHHYIAFHDAGYETYDFNYAYYIIGKDIENIKRAYTEIETNYQNFSEGATNLYNSVDNKSTIFKALRVYEK